MNLEPYVLASEIELAFTCFSASLVGVLALMGIHKWDKWRQMTPIQRKRLALQRQKELEDYIWDE